MPFTKRYIFMLKTLKEHDIITVKNDNLSPLYKGFKHVLLEVQF